jgi:hypothetical protein
MIQDVQNQNMRANKNLQLILGSPTNNTLISEFIIYSCGVQITHAKMRWNPLSLANKIQ